MSLQELGNEYLEQSDLIYKKIHELRPKLKTSSGVELLDLRQRLTIMYSMALDLKITANNLLNYYVVA